MSKVWFVTGAGSGIGAGIAQAALRAGESVVATGRSLDKLREALHGSPNERLALVQLDVADESQARAALAQALERFGRIDVVVNSAGYSLLGNFEEMSLAEFRQQLETNLYGVLHVMRAALPVMRTQRSGRIINISSLAGVVGFKHCAAYAASKFAVEGLSQSVAAEVERFGIQVMLVEPGFFRTDLLAERNVRWPAGSIDDYASDGDVQQLWSAYDGTQQGDPLKLGEALVRLAGTARMPKQFFAGSDALALIRPALEARLRELQEHEALSKSTDGTY